MSLPKGRASLGEFDGKIVDTTSIKVTNAGDGLSAAMAVDPEVMHLGETRYVVLECVVADVAFVPSKDDDEAVVRVHKLRAGDAAIVSKDLVVEAIRAQRERIDEAKGLMRFEFPEGDAGLELAELLAAIEEALEAATVFHDVDPAKAQPLIAGLVDAGWTTTIDEESGGIKLTAPNPDGRSFVFKVSDNIDDPDAASAEVTPIGKGRRKPAQKKEA